MSPEKWWEIEVVSGVMIEAPAQRTRAGSDVQVPAYDINSVIYTIGKVFIEINGILRAKAILRWRQALNQIQHGSVCVTGFLLFAGSLVHILGRDMRHGLWCLFRYLRHHRPLFPIAKLDIIYPGQPIIMHTLHMFGFLQHGQMSLSRPRSSLVCHI